MTLTIHHTGSGGNFNVVTFLNGKKIIVDFGKTAKYSAYSDFCENGYKASDFEIALITHAHQDHAGDVEHLERLGIPVELSDFENEDFDVRAFPVEHNVACNGFLVYSKRTNELYAHCTDFSAIPSKSLEILAGTISAGISAGVDVLFACEVAYCDFLYKKLPDRQRIGLENHCSLSAFCEIMKMIPSSVRVVTLHASGREYDPSAVNASVCPKDWVVNNVRKRCGRFVNFGINKMSY